MRSVETEGASIDEAIDRALRALGVERSQVEVDIIEDADRGLFGLGGRKARVRATVRASPSGVSRETVTGDGPAQLARNIAQEIVAHLVDEPRVEIDQHDGTGTISLSVISADGGAIIGRRGQTLDALEHIVNRIVFRDERSVAGRVSIDVEGYRERREESLRELARRLARKARETGEAVTVNPLSPRDRRIVHIELESDATVSTRSEGEGLFRRLLIIPEAGSRRR